MTDNWANFVVWLMEDFGHTKGSEQMILQRGQEDDEERVDRVQLGVIQAASLPVGLGNEEVFLRNQIKDCCNLSMGKQWKQDIKSHHSPTNSGFVLRSFIKALKNYKGTFVLNCENTNMKNAVLC